MDRAQSDSACAPPYDERYGESREDKTNNCPENRSNLQRNKKPPVQKTGGFSEFASVARTDQGLLRLFVDLQDNGGRGEGRGLRCLASGR